MKKRILIIVATVPLLFGAWTITERVSFDRNAWLADFEQLKDATEKSYANLKWAQSSKQVDMPALHDQTLAALKTAKSSREARAAIGSFVAGFKDGHFRLVSGPPRPVAAVMGLWQRHREVMVDHTMSGAQACRALGFAGARHSLDLDHPGLVPASATAFAAGTMTLANGRKYGIIRIPLFNQRDYGTVCERVWEAFRSASGAVCDDACLSRFSIAVKYEVAAQLARDARLVAESADALVIDLTGNGGGTEWAEFAAAALTPIQLRKAPPAFVRGDHWSRTFQSHIDGFERDLAKNLGAEQRRLVEAGLAHAKAMQDSARTHCDLSEIWSHSRSTPDCWNVVVSTPYTTAPDTRLVAGLESAHELTDDAVALQQEQPYTGKLYIMVDQNTASAAELFAALLQDNRAASIIGTKTMGVGCGYTNGGIKIKLERSGLEVKMPDCARLRADGSNEYDGVQPDVRVDWGNSAVSKGNALAQALLR